MNAFRSVVATPKDAELASPPPDSISKIAFSPTQDILAVGSWDNNVRFYDVNSTGQSQPKAMYDHAAPILDLCWSPSGQHLFSAGCDNQAKMYDLQTGQASQIAQHDAPIKSIRFVEGHNVVATAGWDKTLKYWDMRTPNAVATVQLADKAYSMDVQGKLMVIATGNRKIDIVNTDNPGSIFKSIESPLKWQTRVVACFPDLPGQTQAYAIGSVEGRVAIQHPAEDDKSVKNYSFKCHRYDITPGSMPNSPASSSVNQASQNVFAINSMTFHKTLGTFCTGGGDGSIVFWDGVARTKVKPFSLKELNNGDETVKPIQYGTPIVSTAFNHNHELFAYAMSYDWSKGHSGVPPAGSNVNKVMLHPVKADEVQKKPKVGGR